MAGIMPLTSRRRIIFPDSKELKARRKSLPKFKPLELDELAKHPRSHAVWIILEAMSDEPAPINNEALDWARREIEACQRDEHDALKAAAPDLVRLDRYGYRAWLRQKRAIEEFMMIKVRSTQRIPAAEDGAAYETQVLAG
jgi:hypothetical protein